MLKLTKDEINQISNQQLSINDIDKKYPNIKRRYITQAIRDAGFNKTDYFLSSKNYYIPRNKNFWEKHYNQHKNGKNIDIVCEEIGLSKSVVKKVFNGFGWSIIRDIELMNERIKQTNLKKYGLESHNQSEEVKENKRKTIFKKRTKEISERIKKYDYKLMEEYTGRDNPEYKSGNGTKCRKKYKIKHLTCGTIFEDDLFDLPRCPHCFKDMSRSQQEEYYVQYIRSLGITNIETNNRNLIRNSENTAYLEIDIYLPDYKIGFEFNGLVYHSLNNKYGKPTTDKNYHQNKSFLALEKGIKLYHIWEGRNEKIVKSMIRNVLNKTVKSKRIYARKTEFKEVNTLEARLFLDNNHLFGNINSSYNFGLFYKKRLISLITYKRINNNEIEIARFCSRLNYSIIGGFSKLLKNSIPILKENGFNKIITYADIDWSPDKKETVYYKTGFNYLKHTQPSLYYTDYINIYNRQKYQKQKLEKLFPDTYKEDLSANDILILNDIHPFYNCGNWKFELLI